MDRGMNATTMLETRLTERGRAGEKQIINMSVMGLILTKDKKSCAA